MKPSPSPPRLFVEYSLQKNHAVPASFEQLHYLRGVMRRKNGEEVRLFNGRDGEWRARISFETRTRCMMIVEDQLQTQRTPPDIWLVFAPVKAAAMLNIAKMTTELGIGRLCPVMTDHTQATRVNTARLRANAVEAAEQSQRLNVPAVDEPVPLPELMSGWDPARRIVLCAESGPASSVAEVFENVRKGGSWAVLTGPEGGFSRSELDALAKIPFVIPTRLGPRILKADTAAAAVLACWQSLLGDWTA